MTAGPRPVRAPRGTTLTARSWQTEAPLRMLMNNLDPEVAERPDDLVVYGGTGKAARSWDAYDAIVRTLTTLGDDETLLVQSGKPVGVLTTHEWAPRVLIANSNLVGDWATWPEFRRLEQLGLTMYGQMTAGSWIYIGTQGILQGTYETLAAVAAKRFGGTLAGHPDRDRRLRRHGWRAAARRHAQRGRVPDRRRRRRPPAPPRPRALPRPGGDEPRRGGRAGHRRPRGAARALRRRRRQLRDVAPRAAAPRRRGRRRHRPDLRARPAVLPAGRRRRGRLGVLRRREARGVHRPRARVDGPARRGDGRVPGRGRRGVRLRQLDPRRGPSGRLRPGVRLPRLRPRVHPPAVRGGQGPVPLGRAVGRPARHRRHRPGRARPVPRRRPPAPLDPRRPGPGRVPGAARADLLARARRPRPRGAAVQRARRVRRGDRPARHRARPPRRRLRRVAVPGDGGHGRRVRRHRRLAAAERAGRRVVGSHLGVDPPRRRRRHGPLDPRRAGVRRRRHRPRRAQARARAVQRPGHGRAAARGRRATRGADEVATAHGLRVPMREDARDVPATDVAAADRGHVPPAWDDLAPVGRAPTAATAGSRGRARTTCCASGSRARRRRAGSR